MIVFTGRGGTLVHSCPYFGTGFCGVPTWTDQLSQNPTSMQLSALKGKAQKERSSTVCLLLHRPGCNWAEGN